MCFWQTVFSFKFFSFPFHSGGRTGPTGRDRHSPPLPSRSGYKGRPVCRCNHSDLPSLPVQWPIGQIRCCHDRRDYTEGPGAAGESPHQRRRTVNLLVDLQHHPLLSTPLRLAGSRTRSWRLIGQGWNVSSSPNAMTRTSRTSQLTFEPTWNLWLPGTWKRCWTQPLTEGSLGRPRASHTLSSPANSDRLLAKHTAGAPSQHELKIYVDSFTFFQKTQYDDEMIKT